MVESVESIPSALGWGEIAICALQVAGGAFMVLTPIWLLWIVEAWSDHRKMRRQTHVSGR